MAKGADPKCGSSRLEVKGQRVAAKVAYATERSSSLTLAMSSGTPFYVLLIRGLKSAAVGPERMKLCQLRRREAREALDQVRAFADFTEESLSSDGQCSLDLLDRLGAMLVQVRALCHRLDHAIEILEANSSACGESDEAMAEYKELYDDTVECSVWVAHLSRKVALFEERTSIFALWFHGCPCVRRSGDMVVVLPAVPTPPSSLPPEVNDSREDQSSAGIPGIPSCANNGIIKRCSKGYLALQQKMEMSETGDSSGIIVRFTQFGGIFTCLIWMIS
mmetsp:Transcript_95128/g.293299  ORF Transcript_95128/g.293299 Transcript_95128/m.293299 type:complete len:277 (+) Transcript_95128:33-863(+)